MVSKHYKIWELRQLPLPIDYGDTFDDDSDNIKWLTLALLMATYEWAAEDLENQQKTHEQLLNEAMEWAGSFLDRALEHPYFRERALTAGENDSSK